MSALPEGYRRYEEFAKGELSKKGVEVTGTTRALDVKGIDLEGVTPKGKTLGVYARARFGAYRDITFNGMGAIIKLVENCKKYDQFVCVLHYATGKGFTDPDSCVFQTYFIDLGRWVKENEFSSEKLRQSLAWKEANGGFFVLPKSVWAGYIFGENRYDPPEPVGM